jgi:FAD dependent oxidoreductase
MNTGRLLVAMALLIATPFRQAEQFDLVVYGGTAAGVMTAVAAARDGLNVALLEPSNHLGGMVTSGLSRTDFGKKEVIGGLALEFYQRVGKKYGREIEWMPEPRIAEAVLNEMVQDAKHVTVFLQHRLKEPGGVTKHDTRISEIVLDSGELFQGAVFADATYEGDLLAQANVDFTWGRESTAQYNESLAGVRPKDRNHQFDFPVSAYSANKKLLPGIQSGPRGDIGAGDRKVQASMKARAPRICRSVESATSVERSSFLSLSSTETRA